jgi:radical SAM superfamily enzyme YgiQ (UPF0313 family)
MSRPVVLVSLDWIRPGDPRTGLGIASIAASLHHAGVEFVIVADAVNRLGFDADTFVGRVVDAARSLGKSALVGIGAFVWNEPEVVRLIIAVRALSAAKVVIGGPQVSFVSPGQLEGLYPGVDYFVRGHGEGALVALATGEATEGVDGLHIAGTNDRGMKADLPLESLPSPYLTGTLSIEEIVRWETQRGCPFACTFCQHREPGARLVRRELGGDRLRAEISAFVAAGVRRISVLDPIFHTNRDRAIGLLQDVGRAGLTAELSLQCRFELVEDAFLDALRGLNVVLEFGLQTTHDDESKAINRPNRMDRVSNVIDQLHALGIPFEVSLIYGLPLQTLERFRASVRWCLEHRVPRVRAWPLMLLRGTPLHADRERWGFAESVGERIPIVVASDMFSRDDHAEMASLATWLDNNPGVFALPAGGPETGSRN